MGRKEKEMEHESLREFQGFNVASEYILQKVDAADLNMTRLKIKSNLFHK